MTTVARQTLKRRHGGQLTEREKETLLFMGKGLSNKEIARLNGISPSSVQDHVKSIFAKLDVGSRVEAAVWACKQGML